jgi:hypothetical protein
LKDISTILIRFDQVKTWHPRPIFVSELAKSLSELERFTVIGGS